MNIKQFFKYITNNENKPRHEAEFDVVFFIVNTVTLIGGIILLLIKKLPEWIPFLIIEYCWAMDNLRHNRE